MDIVSLRPFLGARDFTASRAFYQALGFQETVLNSGFSVFRYGEFSFYLQDAYVKDWIDNLQVFLEVKDLDALHADLVARKLDQQFPGVRLSAIKTDSWGRECFLHDPSGILWHFGCFNGMRP
jgi:catechol 2,3-dioxygenase-like lactoylglutathione lyase family enzyme